MYELAIRYALKTLIESNSSILTQGLIAQGSEKVIAHVTYSGATPPQAYYFISITTDNNQTRNRQNTGVTTRRGQKRATYSVIIEIGDYAFQQETDDELFETCDANFQIFTDRLVALIESQEGFLYNDFKFKLEEEQQSIQKSNLSTAWQENSLYHTMMYSRITFEVVQNCEVNILTL